jgi:isoleucyl-tRNA synthetase
VLDERGNKMSKSLGNVVDPRNIIEGGKDAATAPPYGADVLRLWVASVDYSTDVMVRVCVCVFARAYAFAEHIRKQQCWPDAHRTDILCAVKERCQRLQC